MTSACQQLKVKELLYGWHFTANQFVLAQPLETHDQ
jgi:hypothetical protein